jgi:dihydroflavonol-4-reductase
MWMEDIAQVLREHLGADARKVPSRRMPTPVLKLMALFSRDIRQIAGEVGKRKVVSGQHAKDKLGWTTRSPTETVLDTARSLIAQGVVRL